MDAPVDAPEPVAREVDPRALLPEGLVFADLYTRFAAYFLDTLLVGILTSVPPTLLGLYDTTVSEPFEPMTRATFVGTSIFGLAIQTAYFLWFWTGGRRATPGQRAFNVQVGNAFDGEPLTMNQAIVRWLALGWWINLLVLLPFFGLAVVAYAAGAIWWVVLGVSVALSPTKQGIHDRLARSAMVRPAGPTSRWAIGCLWSMVILLVLEVVLIGLLVMLVNSIQDAGLYPPGLDPWAPFTEQIQEFWPA